MRTLVVFLCLLGIGCGGSQAPDRKDAQVRKDTPHSSITLYAPPGCAGSQAPDNKQAPPPNLQTRQGGSDWPCFLGPAGNSTSTEKGILSPWPEKGPRLVWQKKTGQGFSAPVISQGRLFLFDRHGTQATLHCWKSETAEPLWKFEYPTFYRDHYRYNGGPRCCPVVDGDRVYLHGVEGMLHCLRVSDGKLLWKVDTREQFGFIQNFFGVVSTPVIEEDLLIVQVGGSPKGSERVDFADLKGNGSGVVAFDKHNGKVRYQISDELASCASPVLATINGRRWCFVLARGGLLAFEPKSGKVDFHFPWRAEAFESANASNPVVVGDRVFLSECYGPGGVLLQVRPGGYKMLWSDKDKRRGKSMQCHWMTPIHHEGYLYGCSGRHLEQAELRCIELATGKVMWTQPNLTRSSLLMVDGHFVCLAEEGMLYLLKVNPKRFEVVSRVELRDPGTDRPLLEFPCWAAPVLAHGLLYVRSEGRLVCLELIPPKKQ